MSQIKSIDCPPSLSGSIVRVERNAFADVLHIKAAEFVDVDVRYFERDGDAVFKVVGAPGTFEKHRLDAALSEGLPVMAWVRPAWTHIVIAPYDWKPVVWR